MSNDTDIDYEIITNIKQMAPPRPLRKELVVLKGIKTVKGKNAAMFCCQLPMMTFLDWRDSTEPDRELRFLALTLQDGKGNCLFADVEAVKRYFGEHGWASVAPLAVAASEANYADVEDAEKNSEEAKSDSSPSS
jgi:hypothetical protein